MPEKLSVGLKSSISECGSVICTELTWQLTDRTSILCSLVLKGKSVHHCNASPVGGWILTLSGSSYTHTCIWTYLVLWCFPMHKYVWSLKRILKFSSVKGCSYAYLRMIMTDCQGWDQNQRRWGKKIEAPDISVLKSRAASEATSGTVTSALGQFISQCIVTYILCTNL